MGSGTRSMATETEKSWRKKKNGAKRGSSGSACLHISSWVVTDVVKSLHSRAEELKGGAKKKVEFLATRRHASFIISL